MLSILGFHARPACGQKGSTLATADPERAFTTDSGFPLTALEEALEKGETFTYAFPESRVPVLFNDNDWKALSAAKNRARRTWSTSCCMSPRLTALIGRLPIPMSKPGMRSNARLVWEDFCPMGPFSISMEPRSTFAPAAWSCLGEAAPNGLEQGPGGRQP